MPPRDSQVSFAHLKSSHHVLYMSSWVRDKLPFDPVDVPQVQFEDDQENTTLSNTAFGSIKSHKKNNEPIWKDLELHKLISDDINYIKDFEDSTLLAKLDRIHESKVDIFDESNISLDSSFSQNTSSSSSLPSIELTTPDIPRTRPGVRQRSTTREAQNVYTQDFQTPIGRIMR